MNKTVRNIIHKAVEKPKTLFLIDSLGAILTALFLFIATFENFNEYFGMPAQLLAYLSIIAVCLCLYSTTCFFLLKENHAPFIRTIGIFNLLYSVSTMGLIFAYYSTLTIIGISYFLVEITIVCILGYIELNVAAEINKINQQHQK